MDREQLPQTLLFKGMTADEIRDLLRCLGEREVYYQKDETIYHMGDTVTAIGMILSGAVLIENDDIWGNRSILDHVGEGQIFGETYACVPGEKLRINVRAASPSRILFLEVGRVLRVCSSGCRFHHHLIQNLLEITAYKNLKISRRIFNTSAKSIRGRLLSFLSDQAVEQGGREFDIAFDRQQLADYLSVDRSALSHEIGKMQKEGLILVKRNHFKLLNIQEDPLCS